MLTAIISVQPIIAYPETYVQGVVDDVKNIWGPRQHVCLHLPYMLGNRSSFDIFSRQFNQLSLKTSFHFQNGGLLHIRHILPILPHYIALFA